MAQSGHFPVEIASYPKGAGELLFESMSCQERLSEPFNFQLTALSEKDDIKAEDLLGQPIGVSVQQPLGGERHFHGLVSRFVVTGERTVVGGSNPRTLYRYQLRLQPWFWFLSRAADCRVFQKKTVVQIFEALAKEHKFQDYEVSLTGTYEPREYCVQYRETDFNFLSRLLEEVGIRYFFRHQEDKHVMVLADSADAHRTADHYDQVRFGQTTGALVLEDALDSWWVEHAVQPGTYATTDFDFEKPTLSLLKSSVNSRNHARSAFEVFDYPAFPEQVTPAVVERLAKVRLEELQSAYERYHGTAAHCVGLRTGAKFTLKEHPQAGFDREYIIVGTSHSITSNQYASGDGGWGVSVAVEAIDSKTPFRPARVTPKPVIQGTQSAIVVGQSGAEIDTDKYGRVKVQFHWDRQGKKDENSSCWVRVAQVWAGKNWGAVHTPRLGQEVLVSFMEGDPDRPIITGRVYNGDLLPPYLPDNPTQSGVVSRSSKQGADANYNEIRFEDKKGSEQLLFHAEKDLITEVEHDQTITIGNDEKVEIKHDRTSTIKNNETCNIDNDLATTVGNDEKRDVSNNRTAKVGADEKLTVGANQQTQVSQKYTLKAGTEIVLEVGASKLVMKADGTIQLNGVDIKIDGSASIKESAGLKYECSTVQYKLAGTVLQIQGTQTAVQSTLLDLNASAVATLKGSLTMIG